MNQLLNSKSPVPLHLQLEEILRKNIQDGVWAENEMIPSENELSRQYNLSRMTVRNVIMRLVQEGLLYRVQGKGTFVNSEKIVGKPLSYMGIRKQLEQKGYVSTTKTVDSRQIAADEELAKMFRIPVGSAVFLIARLRYVGQLPFSLHLSYIPVYLCPDLLKKKYDFEAKQLCDILEENYRIIQEKVIETLEIVHADDEKAELLEVKKGFSLLHLEDMVFGSDDHMVEYTNVFFRGDRIKLEIVNTYN